MYLCFVKSGFGTCLNFVSRGHVQKPPPPLRKEKLPPVVDATWGTDVGLCRFRRFGEPRGNAFLSLCWRARSGRYGGIHEFYPGLTRLTQMVFLETFLDVCKMKALLHRYPVVSIYGSICEQVVVKLIASEITTSHPRYLYAKRNQDLTKVQGQAARSTYHNPTSNPKPQTPNPTFTCEVHHFVTLTLAPTPKKSKHKSKHTHKLLRGLYVFYTPRMDTSSRNNWIWQKNALTVFRAFLYLGLKNEPIYVYIHVNRVTRWTSVSVRGRLIGSKRGLFCGEVRSLPDFSSNRGLLDEILAPRCLGVVRTSVRWLGCLLVVPGGNCCGVETGSGCELIRPRQNLAYVFETYSVPDYRSRSVM